MSATALVTSSIAAPKSVSPTWRRFRDGYGLQPATLDRLHQDGTRVVISVDCGIRAAEAANLPP